MFPVPEKTISWCIMMRKYQVRTMAEFYNAVREHNVASRYPTDGFADLHTLLGLQEDVNTQFYIHEEENIKTLMGVRLHIDPDVPMGEIYLAFLPIPL